MTTSAPDFTGLVSPVRSVSTPTSSSEISRVIFQESFDGPSLGWVESSTGTPTLTIETDNTFSGQGALKLYIAALSGQIARCKKYIGHTREGTLYVELQLMFSVIGTGNFRFQVYDYDGTNDQVAGVQINPSENWVNYIYTTGSYVTARRWTVPGGFKALAWYTLKMAVDLDNSLYKYVEFNGDRHDLSDITLYSEASTDSNRIELDLYLANSSSAAITAYADDLVVCEVSP